MKRVIILLSAICFASICDAQYYGTYGTATSTTDMFGTTRTTYQNSNGYNAGTSTSNTDMFGTTKTTYQDSYGRTVGTFVGCESQITKKRIFG